MTQAQLAARARTSQAAISRIERGLVSPRVETAARLLDLLGEDLRLSAERIDYGHDRTLLRENLRLTPEERIRDRPPGRTRSAGSRLSTEAFDPIPALEALADSEVDFVVIGGVAGGAHGSAYPTYDIDVMYARDRENLERLATVLRDCNATPRGAPADSPFALDAETLAAGGNFTFSTRFGPLDILAYPSGAPPYERVREEAAAIDVGGRTVRIASLDHLIAMKEVAGGGKDKLMATEYRELADEVRQS